MDEEPIIEAIEDEAGYVEIAGHPTWIIHRGVQGRPVLLLHGGLGDSEEMLAPLGPALSARRSLIAFDRRGHGRTADTGKPFHFADMTDETVGVITHFGLGPVDIVGWSDGGIIGLLLALQRPELVARLVAIGANYSYKGFSPENIDREAPYFTAMADRYGAISPDRREHFPSVADRVLQLWSSEPDLTTSDLAAIGAPVLVMAGDRDLIPLAHTASLFEALPRAQLAIVPGTSHGLIAEKPDLVGQLILDFLEAPL
jgi:pimeloyl-ACP methyl ester carboxylesterase